MKQTEQGMSHSPVCTFCQISWPFVRTLDGGSDGDSGTWNRVTSTDTLYESTQSTMGGCLAVFGITQAKGYVLELKARILMIQTCMHVRICFGETEVHWNLSYMYAGVYRACRLIFHPVDDNFPILTRSMREKKTHSGGCVYYLDRYERFGSDREREISIKMFQLQKKSTLAYM